MKRSLAALAVGTFALGIAEFGMMGILDTVSGSLGVSVVAGGNLISLYSLGVAVGAPMLLLLRNMPLKRLMLTLSAVICLGNLAAALAPGFGAMLCARFVSGLPHGAYFGAGAILCTRLASAGGGASAVAVMVGGMTLANLAGVPLATLVSNLFGWRYVFGAVALTGLCAFAAIWSFVPKVAPLPVTGLKGQFRFLGKSAPWLIYAGVFFGQASVYCWLSYIEPIMTRVTGFTTADMTWIMMLAGLGMVVGNALSGRLADRYGAARVTAWIAASLIIVMPLLYLLSGSKVASLPLMFIATASLFGIGGPLQFLIVRYATGGEMLGGAGIQIAFNVSNAMSAAVGGLVIHLGLGLASPALVGVPFAAIGSLALFTLWRRYDRGRSLPSQGD